MRIASSLNQIVTLIKRNRFFKYSAIFSGLFVIAIFVLVFWKIIPQAKISGYIPLHYNIYLGIDKIGPWQKVFVIPGMALVLYLVNIIFEAIFLKREHVLSYFFAVGTVAAEIVFFIATILVIKLNS
ncbi:MAG: hypothetical protein ACD_76C00144G0006 [uncultured bacterium]|nr:MAG: hypothetical protein ACD_76C00144G0006 [uncultured bacterium]HBD05021.1 hypothetical protein [Candidatus Uhrbacteria bacterium]